MRRRGYVPATALSFLPAVIAALIALPAEAEAEPAGAPSSANAGRLDVGKFHSCALLPGASLRCWGYGGDGALGYANKISIGDDETPAATPGVDVGVGRTATAVSAGAAHTCAVLDDETVRCWGFGGDGRLGYANARSVGDDEAPGSIGPVDLGAGRTAKAITAGRAHTCAVLDGGDVRCWGYGFDGRLGYATNLGRDLDTIGDNETPGSIGPVKLGAGRTATAITAGDSHTCALLDGGDVRCWGFGGNGQLGYGNTDLIGDDETPDTVGPVKLGGKAVAIAAGDFHTCAVLADGKVRCWGFGGSGRLGYANADSIGDDETPDAIAPVDLGPGRTAKAITAGGGHTCVVLDDGSVRCWGNGIRGQLGYGNIVSIGDDEPPAAAGPVELGPGRTATAISAGGDQTCARLDDASIRCWGRGVNGELGYCSRISIGDDETPSAAGPIDFGVPGARGAPCPPPPAPPAPDSPASGASAPADQPAPLAAPVQKLSLDPSATDPVDTEKRRSSGLRGCRATAAAQARRERSRARQRYRRGSARTRALRRSDRTAVERRRACLKRFGRTPGRVTTLAARATATDKIILTFEAPGSDSSRPPAARGYLVKQSLRPIRSAAQYARAGALCRGTCRFAVTVLGTTLTLTVTDLRPRRTYYYAIAARDNVTARPGPRSKTIDARTRRP